MSVKLVRGAAILLLVAGGLLFVSLWLPAELIQQVGGRIRHVSDVTQERLERFRQLCLIHATIASLLALGGLRNARRVAEFGRALVREVRGMVRDLPHLVREHFGGMTLAVICLGICVRLWYLWVPMDYDEAYTFLNFARRPWYEAISDYNSTNNHLLNTFLMHLSYRVFGQQDWALRLPVLGAGIGVLLLVPIWSGVWWGRRAADLTTTLVAVSPLLTYYSVNARGYVFVTLAALTLDLAMGHLASNGKRRALAWFMAAFAIVFGLWAMPIMVYPIAGVSLRWMASGPRLDALAGGDSLAWSHRLGSLVLLGFLTAVGVVVLYSPAYLFRGLVAFDHPFVLPLPWNEWIEGFVPAWTNAFLSWTEGPFPTTGWVAAFLGGCLVLGHHPTRVSMVAMFLATAGLMALQRVAPPERLFLFLAPWGYSIAACGIDGVCRGLAHPRRWVNGVIAVVAASAVLSFGSRPVAYDPHERAVVVSVPEVVRYLAEKTGEGKHRVLTPLPCDLPMLYEMEKQGFHLPQNGIPESGETLWIVTRPEEKPSATLENMVVRLADWGERLPSAKVVHKFSTLWLWRSERPIP